jgi:hypothetical protein
VKNLIDLLKRNQDSTHNFQEEKYKAHALHKAKHRFYLMRQDRSASVQEYYEKFKNQVEVIEHCGGSMYESSFNQIRVK